jgi:ribosomal protein S3AE
MAIAKRKKRFFDVEIPLINRETQLMGFEISELDGKQIKYDLTRILRGKGSLLDLKVTVKEDKATSKPTQINVVPYYIRRMMRKGADYVEDSFSTECKNGIIHIKPFLIARRKISRAVRRALRDKAKEEIINYVKTKTANELFEDILKNKIQKELSLKMKKIYPLSLFEIRSLKVEKEIESNKKEEEKEESSETTNSKE